MATPDELQGITDFRSLVAYLRDELDWEIPEDLPLDKLTYSYTADELGLNLDAQVEITQLRPILGQAQPWGVFFVDFDKAELPVGLLKRILSGVSRKKRASANPGDRALFEKDDLLFVSAFGKAEDRRLALAHFHQDPDTTAWPTLRVLGWDRHDTPRHMKTVSERLDRLRWPSDREPTEAWKSRWAGAFIDRPREAIRTSKEMATALADCAKQIREAIQEILPKEKKGQPLTQLFEAVKAALNKDLDVPKFADTYAQTIAYGLLSKRIDQVQRWRAEKARTLNSPLPLPPITAEALETAIPTNPFLSELLTSFMSAVGRNAGGSALNFDELGLGDLVDLLNTANMEAVLDDFDKDKQGDDPVIHFYEGFLAAYDKAMKVQRGVFYTPKPVVSFIVRSVDEVLRTQFGLPLGLADTTTWGEFMAAHPDSTIPDGVKLEEPFVKILDPATGTGTFLVEVIDLIHRRMADEVWKDKPAEEKRQLWNAYVAEHLLPRLYGYELMMAPYAVAHMKIGLKLADTGYDFSGNEVGPDRKPRPMRARVFLTNALEPAQDISMQLTFLNDALAHEAKAANDAKAGARFSVVVGNPPYSAVSGNLTPILRAIVDAYRYVDGEKIKERSMLQFEKNIQDDYVKFVRMSQQHISRGSGVAALITNHSYIDGITLRGMRQSLLSTFETFQVLDLHGNATKNEARFADRVDKNIFPEVSQGVAIFLGTRGAGPARFFYGDVWGDADTKESVLARSTMRSSVESHVRPMPPHYRLRPNFGPSRPEWQNWTSIDTIFELYSTGVETGFDSLLQAFDHNGLEQQLREFDDSTTEDIVRRYELRPGHGFDLANRKPVLAALSDSISPLQKNPFDFRPTLLHKPLLKTNADKVFQNVDRDHPALVSTRQTKEHFSAFVVDRPAGHKLTSGYDRVSVFPLELRTIGADDRRLNARASWVSSLGAAATLTFDEGRGRGDLITTFGARDLFDWIYAVLHSPAYRDRYADFLKSDFARVPLPRGRDRFAALVPLGTRLVGLHLLDAGILPELLAVPEVRFVSNGGEPRLGRFNKEVRRDAAGRVYLNDQNWFATVPQAAWDHWIGGYQPAQKWLKDRAQTGSKEKLEQGRLLTQGDILHYRRMIVALEETSKVMAEIDTVVGERGGWPGAFRGMAAGELSD